MEQGESSVAHGPEHGLERLIFFSDAVFAIAITLLVIDIHVPHLPWGSADAVYARALLQLAPQFAGFFISFFVIGSFWSGHHRTMMLASHYVPALGLPNLVLLSTVAAIPFFTAFASANPLARVPAVCYCGWLFVTALANRRLQLIATSPPVVDLAVAPGLVTQTRTRGVAVMLGAATATTVSLVVPLLGQVALSSIPLWRALLQRRVTAGKPATS